MGSPGTGHPRKVITMVVTCEPCKVEVAKLFELTGDSSRLMSFLWEYWSKYWFLASFIEWLLKKPFLVFVQMSKGVSLDGGSGSAHDQCFGQGDADDCFFPFFLMC